MLNKIIKYMNKHNMIVSGDSLVMGVSGGADSVCLLFVMLELKKLFDLKLAVVHVHHMMRGEADEEAAYVEELCQCHGLPYYRFDEDVASIAAKKGISTEEAGRDIRYEAFQRVLQEEFKVSDGKIAVAHNQNDRAETMLFNLFRGSGIRGLGSIKPIRGNIIRPLLCVERSEIEVYLQERNIKYFHDNSNDEDIYTRNRIRHHILPYAEKEICTGSMRHMAETAEQLLELEEYLSRQIKSEVVKYVDFTENDIIIDVEGILGLEVFIRKNIILYCLDRIFPGKKNVTSAHIASIMELLYANGSKRISLPDGIAVKKEYNKLTIYRNIIPTEGNHTDTWEVELPIPGVVCAEGLGKIRVSVLPYEKNMQIPQKKYTKYFDYDRITASPMLRTRKQGDYITFNKALSKKSIQDYMINEKIPKEKRDQMLLVADGSHIIWIPGYRISEAYKIKETTERILKITIEGENTNDRKG